MKVLPLARRRQAIGFCPGVLCSQTMLLSLSRSVTRLAQQDGGTRVSYEVDAALTGKLGSLGQPVLRAKAKEMERQFAQRLRAAFAESVEQAR